jgi:hypothetical protein
MEYDVLYAKKDVFSRQSSSGMVKSSSNLYKTDIRDGLQGWNERLEIGVSICNGEVWNGRAAVSIPAKQQRLSS